MSDKAGGPRRGSSLFSGPGAMGGAPPAGNHPPANHLQGSTPVNAANTGGRRGSSAMQVGPSGGGVGFGIDFDDSDYEDSEEDDDEDEDIPYGGPHRGGPPVAVSGGGVPHVTGSANSRPMVGGFAAAAYEAAKAHHFQNMKKQQDKDVRGGEPKPHSSSGRPHGY